MALKPLKNFLANIKMFKNNPDEDVTQILYCMICLKPLMSSSYTVLNCQHVCHTQCLWNFTSTRGREVITDTTKLHDFTPKIPHILDCPICKDSTKLPAGNIDLLPQTLPENHYVNDVKAKLIIQQKSVCDIQEPKNFGDVEIDEYEDEYSVNQTTCQPGLTNVNTTQQGKTLNSPNLEGFFLAGLGHDKGDLIKGMQETNIDQYSPEKDDKVDNKGSYDTGYGSINPLIPTTINSLLPSHVDDSGIDRCEYLEDITTPHQNDLNPPASITDNVSVVETDQSDNSTDNNNLVAKLCCRQHKKVQCTLFCDSCSMPICDKCSIKFHQGHLIDDIVRLTSSWKAEMNRLQNCLTQSLLQQRKWDIQIDELNKNQMKTYREMRNLVIRHTEKIIDGIQHQRDRFLSQLEHHYRTEDENFKRASHVVKYNIECTETLQQAMAAMVINRAKGEAMLLVNYKTLDWRVKNHIKDIEDGKQYLDTMRKKLTFTPKDDLRGKMLGVLEFNKYTLPEQDVTSPGSKKVNLLKNLSKINTYPQLQWEYMDPPLSIKGQLAGRTNMCPYGALFLEDNSLLVAFDGANTINRFSKHPNQNFKGLIDLNFKLQEKGKHGIHEMTEEKLMPKCMTHIDSTKFACTDARRMTVRIFRNDGFQLHKFKDEFLRPYNKNTKDQPFGYSPSNPFGIAKISNGNLVVSDTIHHRIYILDPSREDPVVQHFGNFGNSCDEFNTPEFMAYDSIHKRIAVSDRHNHVVKLFDTSGKYLSQFGHHSDYQRPVMFQDGTQTSEFYGLNQPTGIVCDFMGNFLVASEHNICRFSADGKFISIINVYKGETKVTLSWPNGIDLSHQGHLAIVEKSSGRILVFNTYS